MLIKEIDFKEKLLGYAVNGNKKNMPSLSIYLVKKRITDDGKLWGFVLQYRSKKYKITKEEMISLVQATPRGVEVDFPGADIPVFLTLVETTRGKVLRTVWDQTIKNNLAQVPEIKLITANKLRVYKTPKQIPGSLKA